MISTVLAFLSLHEMLLLYLGGLAFTAGIHALAPRFPRAVAFAQALLPDAPKMLASLKDQLPPTDQAIARAIDSVASGAATPAAAKAEVLAVTPAAPVVPPAVLGVLSAVAFVLAFVGCSVVLPGCSLLSSVDPKSAIDLAAEACTGILILSGNAAEAPFCATAAEFAKAVDNLATAKAAAGKVGASVSGPSPADLKVEILRMRAGASK